jgi:hypothetical protein
MKIDIAIAKKMKKKISVAQIWKRNMRENSSAEDGCS